MTDHTAWYVTPILAIDPGTTTGWATNANGELQFGTANFALKRGENGGARWNRFEYWLNEMTLTHDIGHDEPKPKVGIIVYERASFMPRSRAAAEVAGGFTTRLEAHCERHGIALHPVQVQTLKAYAYPAPPKTKGSAPRPRHVATKDALIDGAIARLGIARGRRRITHDEADALWLYWLARERFVIPSMRGAV